MRKCKWELQKLAVLFVWAHGHTVSEVAGFNDVSQRTADKQWCNTRDHETGLQNFTAMKHDSRTEIPDRHYCNPIMKVHIPTLVQGNIVTGTEFNGNFELGT